ncbi:hypothetical protein HZC30_03715 [Candidatus Woesearchaeota archaeon]|nr:hypothetical protein [Candidatus Woesearchaeota archaeon]
MKIYENELNQHTWLKVKEENGTITIYFGSDGWFTLIGNPKLSSLY